MAFFFCSLCFSAITTDASFDRQEFSLGQSILRKRLRLAGLCVYVHANDPLSFQSRVEDLMLSFQGVVAVIGSAPPVTWSYILPPVTLLLKLNVRRKPDAAAEQPAAIDVRSLPLLSLVLIRVCVI